jgi:hypothetical protein
MEMTFLDADTTAVYQAGQNTASTATDWQTWANSAKTDFDVSATAVAEKVVADAVVNYASEWNPKLASVAVQVDALGVNTSSSATTVENSDTESTTYLTQQGNQTETVSTTLSRPVNAW